jgi:hypothetical protein
MVLQRKQWEKRRTTKGGKMKGRQIFGFYGCEKEKRETKKED